MNSSASLHASLLYSGPDPRHVRRLQMLSANPPLQVHLLLEDADGSCGSLDIRLLCFILGSFFLRTPTFCSSASIWGSGFVPQSGFAVRLQEHHLIWIAHRYDEQFCMLPHRLKLLTQLGTKTMNGEERWSELTLRGAQTLGCCASRRRKRHTFSFLAEVGMLFALWRSETRRAWLEMDILMTVL